MSCQRSPTCPQTARMSSASKPVSTPSFTTSKGGSGKADATSRVPASIVCNAAIVRRSRPILAFRGREPVPVGPDEAALGPGERSGAWRRTALGRAEDTLDSACLANELDRTNDKLTRVSSLWHLNFIPAQAMPSSISTAKTNMSGSMPKESWILKRFIVTALNFRAQWCRGYGARHANGNRMRTR